METPGTNDNPQQIQNYIARAVAKGYPAEIFSGSRSEDDIVAAMGTHMKNEYLALNYPASVFDSCITPVEVKNAAAAYKEAFLQERTAESKRLEAHGAAAARVHKSFEEEKLDGATFMNEATQNHYIQNAVSKGYPQEIFNGLSTVQDFVLAMGEYLKKKYVEMGYPELIFDGCFKPTQIKQAAKEYLESSKEKRREIWEKQIKNAANDSKELWNPNIKHAIGTSLFTGAIVSLCIPYIYISFKNPVAWNMDSTKTLLVGFVGILSVICIILYILYRMQIRAERENSRRWREEKPPYQMPVVVSPAPVIQVEKTSLQIKEERVTAKEKDVELDIRLIKADENLARTQRSVQLHELDDNISYAQKLGTYKTLVDKLSRTPTALPKHEKPKRLTQDEVDIKLDALLLEESQKISECIANGFHKESEQIKTIESLYEKKRQDLLTGYI